MSILKKNDNNESSANERMENQPSHEGIRQEHCSGRLRRSRTCTCGRPQALTRGRQHHHWLRLSACAHCLRADAARSNADSSQAVDHV
jgi:hypothetical protein